MIVLVCQVILQEHVINGPYDLMGMSPFMVNHHPAKFGAHGHCGSGDITFLMIEEQDSTCSCLKRPIVFISKAHANKYDIGHIRLEQQLKKIKT